MRMGALILCGVVVLLLVCAVPVAANSVKSNGNADTRDKPTMIVEYGTGKDIGLIKVTHIDYAKSESRGKPPQATTCYKLDGHHQLCILLKATLSHNVKFPQ